MIFQVVIENGVKKIKALTADTGTGAPVGSLIYMYKKSSPSGYLYCDGSTFDETKYPALYQYLGSNVLPDYRECVAVGAEQNTTDTIATHDVYTEGQFKDDQMQEHIHNIYNESYGSAGNTVSGGVGIKGAGGGGNVISQIYAKNLDPSAISSSISDGRHGDTTHGKQKAVFIYIKATSGLTENQQENVLNTINENNSYSTEEHATGKKWIDGKPIYEKTYTLIIADAEQDFNHLISNLDKVVKMGGVIYLTSGVMIPFGFIAASGSLFFSGFCDSTKIYTRTVSTYTNTNAYITLEYTKTTDN